MAIDHRSLLLEDGTRAPRTEVKRTGHEWEGVRKTYRHEPLENAIATFTATAGAGIDASNDHGIWLWRT